MNIPGSDGQDSRGRLAGAFLDRSVWVFQRLMQAEVLGLRMDEDALTQHLLVDLKVMVPELEVRVFNRLQESRNGADWEWWFHGLEWFGIRIQAKRLKQQRGGLGYDFDYRLKRGDLQVDLLLADARRSGMHAGYVLYNGPSFELEMLSKTCQKVPPDPESYGATFVPAIQAKRLQEDLTMDVRAVADRWLPLPCLVACGPYDGCLKRVTPRGAEPCPPPPGPIGLDKLIAWRLSAQELLGRPQALATGAARVRGLRERPPSHVEALLNGGRAREWPDERVSSVAVFMLPGRIIE